jgi:phosphoglycerate kinase
MKIHLVQDVKFEPGEAVILRTDFNVPLDENGQIADDFRIIASLESIDLLLKQGVKIFIISHLGRPNGEVDLKLSLRVVADYLKNYFGDDEVDFDDFKSNKKIILLENIRFDKREEACSESYARELIKKSGAKYFIQDAFGVCHHAATSVSVLPKLMNSAAGLLLQKEMANLNLYSSKKNLLIVGGAKTSDKYPVIENFLKNGSRVITGGVIANSLLKNIDKDVKLGSSIVDDSVSLKPSFLKSKKLFKPVDFRVAKNVNSKIIRTRLVSFGLRNNEMALDLGRQTVSNYKEVINKVEMIYWAGPLGYTPNKKLALATKEILKFILDLIKQKKVELVIGGGDSVDFVRSNLNSDQIKLIKYLSTGGGASLEYLTGKKLPGIVSLNK